MKVSIAIPTYECYGKSGEFLDDLLRTIEIQTFKDFEVCISDHSVNDDVLNVVNEFKDKFEIVFRRNTERRGNGPANTNAAIDLRRGEIVKVMFQDDFFYDELKKIKGLQMRNEYAYKRALWTKKLVEEIVEITELQVAEDIYSIPFGYIKREKLTDEDLVF